MECVAEKRAVELHDSGFHCAESVLLAVLEQSEVGGNTLVPRAASAFQAGVGRSHKEICGALAGGLIALGCLQGRDRAGQPLDITGEQALELRDGFEAIYGSTRCADILERMGPQQGSCLCHQLSGKVAALVCEIIEQDAPAGLDILR